MWSTTPQKLRSSGHQEQCSQREANVDSLIQIPRNTGAVHDDEVGVEPQPSHPSKPLRVHGRVGRIAVPPAPIHTQNLLRGGVAVGHGLPQLLARRPQARFVNALQLTLVRDRRTTCVITIAPKINQQGAGASCSTSIYGNEAKYRGGTKGAPSLMMQRKVRDAVGLG